MLNTLDIVLDLNNFQVNICINLFISNKIKTTYLMLRILNNKKRY